MYRSHRMAAGAAATVILTLGLAGSGTAQAARPADHPEASRAVTLITGDTVTLLPGNAVSVHHGPGRAKIPMLTSTTGGHVSVIPADALPMLNADRVDRRLFDVTELLSSGYGDTRGDLPLIVAESPAATAAAKASSSRTTRRLPTVGADVIRTPKSAAGRFWHALTTPAATGKVWLDAVGHVTGAEGVQQIGAPAAWQAGLTGAGVTVAVLDTGIDTTHPDLAGKVDDQVDFTPVADGGAPTRDDIHDVSGHGTVVASVIAGTGAASGGRYRGVAPDARLISGKVGDGDIMESSLIAAMEWASGEKHARVINISIGFPDSPGDDPLDTAVNRLTAANGSLFVIASGNDGARGVTSPGDADAALTVGAVDHDEHLWAGSSRGPRLGDGAVKPDVTAPGVDVTGAKSGDSFPDPGQLYTTEYGTSLAAPHAAGAAAILAQQHPGWTQPALKSALMGSATPAADLDVYEQGAGRVDVGTAVHAPVYADPPTFSLGQTWPHTDDTPIAKALTYRNTGTRPVTLALRLDVTGPDAKPAPAGLFGLGSQTLTVPAGGVAKTTISVRPLASAPDGYYSGRVTATSGDLHVTTPVGLNREPEQHTLTLEHIDRDGQPTENFYTKVIGLDSQLVIDSVDHYQAGSTALTLRVPSGRYAVVTAMYDAAFNGVAITQPVLDVNADQTVRLDGRQAGAVTIAPPDTGVVNSVTDVTVGVRGPADWTTVDMAVGDGASLYTAQLGKNGSATGFVSAIRAAYPGYQLAWHWPGRLPSGLVRNVPATDLATVNRTYRRQASAADPALETGNGFAGFPLTMATVYAPFTPTVRYNNDPGTTWRTTVSEEAYDPNYSVAYLDGGETTYEAGEAYRESFGDGVLGPCLSTADWTASALTLDVPMFCDAAGHTSRVDFTTGTTTLTRDGALIADGDRGGRATVIAAPKAGRYRLTADASRPSFDLSTRTTADWSFSITAADAGKPLTVPLSVVRFRPSLDATNTAPAGAVFTIPLEVRQQPGSVVQPVTSVRVEASFDEGETWQPAAVTRGAGSTFQARVTHPATPGFVALRATAATATTSATVTVQRAYLTATR
ncbi:S8 family serine peptidase [Actinoplanes sp. TBRC 11911]|uniref:S8 family serine peptidase n=1 Tax=Actinoplanes sp. TBRC 11911 TaxID=2729386 RepID=UPI00145D5819|nr:S8 family serine peptidase [Actinoplanes sp. TBRC 11911]NMO51471.1 S8 family serine peptidase [Actinoplanes sp. TBRC 11911]